jgi:hypothetical protein
MTAMYEHPSYYGRVRQQPATEGPVAPPIESMSDANVIVLANAERSCCCVAKPAVIALIRVGSDRRQVDLLLCMHHYRASRQTLTNHDATVLDASGAVLTGRQLW